MMWHWWLVASPSPSSPVFSLITNANGWDVTGTSELEPPVIQHGNLTVFSFHPYRVETPHLSTSTSSQHSN